MVDEAAEQFIQDGKNRIGLQFEGSFKSPLLGSIWKMVISVWERVVFVVS